MASCMGDLILAIVTVALFLNEEPNLFGTCLKFAFPILRMLEVYIGKKWWHSDDANLDENKNILIS